MRYREFAPAGAASGFIDCYWMLEDAEPGAVQRVVPDGHPELILNLGRPYEMLRDGAWQPQPQCFLAGQITRPLVLRAAGPSHILGVRFQPAGAGQLLGIPAQELADRCVALADLGLQHVAGRTDLREIEQALLECPPRAEDALAGEAVRLLAHGHEVAAVAARLGVSARQLERRFKDRVGMPPKLFARIRRFQRVFHAMEDEGAGWVDAAAACGYYDQAHLIRDFRDFAGEPPAALLAGEELARHFLSHSSKTGGAALR
jgi:AraC-like DNA-binding protein